MRVKGWKGRAAKVQAAVVVSVVFAACARGYESLPIDGEGGSGGTGPSGPGSTSGSSSAKGSTGTASSSSTASSTSGSGAVTSSSSASSAVSSSASSAVSSSASSSASSAVSSSASSSASSAVSSSAVSSSSSGGGPVSGLKLQYAVVESNVSTQDIKYKFKIVNQGAVSVPLTELTMRYWFTATADGAGPPFGFNCDYADVGNGNVNGSFNTASGMNADQYLEVGFKAGAGSLAAGASTGEVQARFHTSNFKVLTQTNDYSFDPTKTSFQDATTVTLYDNGTLVWGTEPPPLP
jgi:hypothetical protein